jgi:hypothetical protein
MKTFLRKSGIFAIVLVIANLFFVNSSFAQTLFSQNFSSSGSVASYVNAAPNTGQFNAITTAGTSNVSISSGALQFVRGNNSASFTRSTSFSPTPTAVIYQFDLTVSGTPSVNATSVATFQVGSNYSTGTNGVESNFNTYAQFAIDFRGTGNFRLNDISNNNTSSNFSNGTSRTVTWAMNNSGNTISYQAPDGTIATVANDRADIWVGTSLIFNDAVVETTNGSITDLKFAFTGSTGTITIDNMLIQVLAIPQVSAFSGNTICIGGTGQLTLTASAGTGPFDVVYNDGTNRTVNGVVSGTPFNTVVNPTTTTNYTLVSVSEASGGTRTTGFTDGTTSITVNSNVATFSYTGSPYCKSASNPSPTYSGGGAAGTFTSTSGLSLNSATGQVNLTTSTPGTYTVTNTRAAVGGCPQQIATSTITITAVPIATFSYAGTPFCKDEANPLPTFSGGGAAGNFTSTSGLVFVNSSTGEINLAASSAGTYTVTNTRVAAGGCAQVTSTSSVTITSAPIATFSYTGSPFCINGSNPSPTYSGGGAAGTFTSTAGLVFVNANTGQVNLSASSAGTYTVTNTRAATGGCSQQVATALITISSAPIATFSYPGTPFCKDEANPLPTFSGGGAAGTFSSTAGLVFVNASTGQVNLSSSTPGTYTVTNTIASASGCSQVTSTASITINALPTSVTATAASAAICMGASVNLNGAATITSTVPATALIENFDGTPTFIESSGSSTGDRSQVWQQEVSGTNVNSIATFTSNGGGGLMVSTAGSSNIFGGSSVVTSSLTSGIINTTGFSSLSTLTFYHTYKQGSSSGSGVVQVSTNGGGTWTTLTTFNSNQGSSTNFSVVSIPFSSYINETNLKLRFLFNTANQNIFVSFTSWWAIDNVVINGNKTAVPQFTWTASPAAVLPNTATITVSPTVNTTYTLTATDLVTGCSATAAPVLVTVYPKPTLNAIANVALNTNSDELGNCSAVHNWTHPIVNTACSTILNVDYAAGSPAPATIPTGGTVTAGNPASVAFSTGATIVTYTATDANGNVATTNFTVTVTDNELPAITCAADVIVNNTPGQCDTTVILTNPVTTDNCGVDTVTNDHSSSNVFPVGVTDVIWTVKDSNNNVSTCTQKVTVNDTELPTIVCAADVSVPNDTGDCSAAVTLTPPTTNDSCSGATTTATRSDALTLADPYPVGPTTVTWKVTDAAGNYATCNQIVTVTDTEQPTITCPDAITTHTDPAVAFATITLLQPVVTDNCGGILTVVNDHPSLAFPIGTTLVNWTVTDTHGVTNTCVQTIVVNDEIDPSIANNPPIDLNNTLTNCDGATDITYPEASDNSGHVTVTSDYVGLPTPSVDPVIPLAVPEVVFPVGQTTIVWTAIDPSSNDSRSTQMITVTDNEPPTITCPSDINQVNDTGLCSAEITLGTPVTHDNCGVLSVSNDHPSAVYPVGETIVTWTVTDIHSNSSSCTQKITVTDAEQPTIACALDVSVNNDSGLCSAVVTLTQPTTDDNCAVASVTNDHSSNVFIKGETIVTWTVTDSHGNTKTCTQKVTVLDNELPIITAPADITQTADAGQCGALVAITAATATDNCGVDAPIGTRSDVLALTAPYPVGTTTISWNVTDVNGNDALVKTQTVTITDDELPIISGIPSDFTVNNDLGNCSKVVTWTAPTATDNCNIASFTSDYASGYVFPVGTTTVTYTATDIHGNVQTATFKVIVTDNEKPLISGMPLYFAVNNDAGNCSAVVDWIAPQPNDNCAIATLVSNHASGDIFPVGTTTVTYTATDIHGNFQTASFDVVVTDSEMPVISNIPANITLNNDSGICGAAATWYEPTAEDNCNIASFASDHASGNTFPVGTTTVTYTATDIHGNILTASFDVVIIDNEKPVIATNGDKNVDTDAGVCGATVLVSASATDNCAVDGTSIGVRSDAQALDALYPIGTTTIAWNVSDIHGNSANEVIQTVIVTDNENPMAITKDITIQLDVLGAASIVASDVDNGSNDACGIKSLAVSPNTFTCANVGTIVEVTLTVTDNNDNVSTNTAMVTVEDKVNPVAIAKDITVQLDDSGAASIVASDVDNGSNDACGIMDRTVSPNEFTCANVGTPVSVILTVLDNNGNSSTANAIVTVEDNVAPIAVAQNVEVQLNTSGNGTTTATLVDNGSSDACGIKTLVLSKTAFTCSDIATNPNTVTLTVTDNNDNVSTIDATVTVKDEVAPIAVAQNVIVQLDNTGNGTTTATLVDNGSNDACGIKSLALSKTAFTCADITTNPNTVTLTVTDNNDNVSTIDATVTVKDEVAPIAVAQNVIVQLDNTGNGTTTATLVDNGSNDACGIKSLVLSKTAFTCADIVTNPNTVTLTVTDNNDNVSTIDATVTVNDEVVPIALAQNVIVQLDNTGNGTTTAALVDNGSNDACGIKSLALSKTAFTCSDITTNPNTVTLTVTDNNDNVSTIDATVTVKDGVAPVAVAQNVIVQLDASGNGATTAALVDNGSNDACGIKSLALSKTAFTCSDIATNPNTVTLTVTDNNDNVSTATATVAVKDNVAPNAVTQNVTIILDASGNGSTTATAVNNGSNDACGIATLVLSKTAFTCADIVTNPNPVTLTVTDVNGNVSTASATATVLDNINPTITAPVATSGTTNVACTSTNVVLGTPATADNCSVASVTNNAPSAFPLGNTTVTWTVKDGSGNTATATQLVTVTDNIKPVLVNVPVNIATNYCMIPPVGTPTATDNCSGTPIVSYLGEVSTKGSDPLLPSYSNYTLTRTWDATDAAGNHSLIGTQVITINGIIVNLYDLSPVPINTAVVLYAKVLPITAGVPISFYVDNVLKGTSLTDVTGKASLLIGLLPEEVYGISASIGGCATSTLGYLPVYDPTKGFAAGNGSFDSPVGAYPVNIACEGRTNDHSCGFVASKARFGFSIKYKKGTTLPQGELDFQLKKTKLRFESKTFQWLVIAGNKAQFMGTGKINDCGTYNFIVTVIDNSTCEIDDEHDGDCDDDRDHHNGYDRDDNRPGYHRDGKKCNDRKCSIPDQFRIQITTTTGIVVYDNQMGQPVSDFVASNITRGAIEVNDTKITKKVIIAEVPNRLYVYPNPSSYKYALFLESKSSEKVQVEVYDMIGRLLKRIESSDAQIIEFGEDLPTGTYFAIVSQGTYQKTVQLIKE